MIGAYNRSKLGRTSSASFDNNPHNSSSAPEIVAIRNSFFDERLDKLEPVHQSHKEIQGMTRSLQRFHVIMIKEPCVRQGPFANEIND